MHESSRIVVLHLNHQARFLEMCRDAGFDLSGFTTVSLAQEDQERLEDFAKQNQKNDLHWFNHHLHLRTHPSDILPGALSVLMLGTIYRHPDMDAALGEARVRISRYAAGKDYHLVLRKKAARLGDAFANEYGHEIPGLQYRITTDSAPVPEKILARMAGLGWQGKNTNLIHPELGSYFFLTGIFFNAELEGYSGHSHYSGQSSPASMPGARSEKSNIQFANTPGEQAGSVAPSNRMESGESEVRSVAAQDSISSLSESPATEASLFRAANVDRCGSCRQCLDACPTGALEPYRIEASKCLSYWTIEAKSDMPPDIAKHTKGWVFGCDICQEVCPYNKGAKGKRQITKEEAFVPRPGIMNWMKEADDPATNRIWDKLSVSSPLKRPGPERFRRSWQVATAPPLSDGNASDNPSENT